MRDQIVSGFNRTPRRLSVTMLLLPHTALIPGRVDAIPATWVWNAASWPFPRAWKARPAWTGSASNHQHAKRALFTCATTGRHWTGKPQLNTMDLPIWRREETKGPHTF